MTLLLFSKHFIILFAPLHLPMIDDNCLGCDRRDPSCPIINRADFIDIDASITVCS